MRSTKKLLSQPIVKADFSYLDKFERLEDLQKLKLNTSRRCDGWRPWNFCRETFLPDKYEISYSGISAIKKTTRRPVGYGRSYVSIEVNFFITIGRDGKYNPAAKEKLLVRESHAFKNHDGYHTLDERNFFTDELERDFLIFWSNYHLQWSAAKSAAIDNFKKKLAEDPIFANEQKVLGDIDRTKAIMAVMQPLQRLRSATDSVIAGIGKGSLSAATLKEWSQAVNTIGNNRLPILAPLKKYFIKK